MALLLGVGAMSALGITEEEELGRFGSGGSGSGRLLNPLGLATDPTTAHVYVNDENSRISEFTPWGEFVKAYGWDVATGAVNEQQEVRVRAASGQFRLSFEGDSTADLAFDAGATDVQAALESLTTIGSSDVAVAERKGTPDGLTPFIYFISFKGALGGQDVVQLQASLGTQPLAGGVPTTDLEVRTRADGTPGGTGLESCTGESGCKAGIPGPGAGQMAPFNIATEAAGNLYVKEPSKRRVQKFDSAGRFVWMVGAGVNITTGGDLCTADSGDQCGTGDAGTGPLQFEGGRGITTGPGAIYASDKDRIQVIGLDGSFTNEVPVPGFTVGEIARDPTSGDFYALLDGAGGTTQKNVRRLDGTTGEEQYALAQTKRGGVVVDSAGNIFAISSETPSRIVEFDNAGKRQDEEFGKVEEGFEIEAITVNPVGTVYASYKLSAAENFVRFFGPAPTSFESPPALPPAVESQYAVSVTRDDAVLAADINPRFWTDTRYYVEYGIGKCSEGGCEAKVPSPPGELLTSRALGQATKTKEVLLEGLTPATTYHYRVVAQSTGGGPAYGVDPDGPEGPEAASFEAGLEGTFNTYPVATPTLACSNDGYRFGAGSGLPDCRAYELVSPIDKNGGDIKGLRGLLEFETSLWQSSEDGQGVTYTSYRSFGDPKAAPFASQYLSQRGSDGWSTEALSPPQGPAATQSYENPFKAFSSDLCTGWILWAAETPQPSPGMEGFPNIYRRDNCDGQPTAGLIETEPSIEPQQFQLDLGGFAGDEAVFRVPSVLAEGAFEGPWQTYIGSVSSSGGLRFVCVLPDGSSYSGDCAPGTSRNGLLTNQDVNRVGSVSHALSEDATRLYWTAAENASGSGKIYLRLNPAATQSASGCETGKACTVKVSETKSTRASRFWGASPDGGRALFEVVEGPAAGKLFRYEGGGTSTELATGLIGIVGTSEDLGVVYFVSDDVLAAGGEVAKPNLYVSENGTTTYISTLDDQDVDESHGASTSVSFEPVRHLGRVSADGGTVAFVSWGRLTGYDNRDLVTGKALSQVYLYTAGSSGPVCLSCNPSGARGRGIEVLGNGPTSARFPIGATLPEAHFQLYLPRALTKNGDRVFFTSNQSLLLGDTNGKADVYEWERGAGQTQCTAMGADLYVAATGGCLSLISSGKGTVAVEFLDASESGNDVFFTTNSSLVPWDPGLVDVYDARVGGGLSGPVPPVECRGESCQPPAQTPADASPASSAYRPPPRSEVKPQKRCPKGKRKVKRAGKVRCVKKAARHQKGKTGNGRNGR